MKSVGDLVEEVAWAAGLCEVTAEAVGVRASGRQQTDMGLAREDCCVREEADDVDVRGGAEEGGEHRV